MSLQFCGAFLFYTKVSRSIELLTHTKLLTFNHASDAPHQSENDVILISGLIIGSFQSGRVASRRVALSQEVKNKRALLFGRASAALSFHAESARFIPFLNVSMSGTVAL